MWADWLGNTNRLTCEDCRELAEANNDIPDCVNCVNGGEPVYASQLNYEAVNLWRLLDFYGRDIDTFAGVPRAMRIEAIDIECGKTSDPDGLKWRVLLLEDTIFTRRIKEFNAKSERRKNKR